MKGIILASILLLLSSGNDYLQEVPRFNVDSYYKAQVYIDHTYKSFFELQEVNQPINPQNYDQHLLNASLFFATNRMRDKKHIQCLQFADGLRNSAMVHSYQMVQKKFFDHYNHKVRDLRTPDNRIEIFLSNSTATAENIDYNHIPFPGNTTYAQVAEVIADDFLHSSQHKKIMLNKNYNQLGCAVFFEYKPNDGVIYFKATQNFATTF